MADTNFPFEAYIELHNRLPLLPDFLGVSNTASVAGIPVSVHLPDFEPHEQEFKLKPPPGLKVDWTKYFKLNRHAYPTPWGKVLGWQPKDGRDGIKKFAATGLIIASVAKVSDKEVQAVLHALEAWRSTLEIWVDVVMATDTAQPDTEVIQHGQDLVMLSVKDGHSEHVICEHGARIIAMLGDPLPLSKGQWEQLLRKASEGSQPPQSHLFLRDARRQFNTKHFRRCVLDAATAAEIALTDLQDKKLPSIPADKKKRLKEKFTQLDGLVDSLTLMDVPIPPAILQDVGAPRNLAIHRGATPDQSLAASCLAKAAEVVELIYPHDRLLD
jgi:hypothetical protein